MQNSPEITQAIQIIQQAMEKSPASGDALDLPASTAVHRAYLAKLTLTSSLQPTNILNYAKQVASHFSSPIPDERQATKTLVAQHQSQINTTITQTEYSIKGDRVASWIVALTPAAGFILSWFTQYPQYWMLGEEAGALVLVATKFNPDINAKQIKINDNLAMLTHLEVLANDQAPMETFITAALSLAQR